MKAPTMSRFVPLGVIMVALSGCGLFGDEDGAAKQQVSPQAGDVNAASGEAPPWPTMADGQPPSRAATADRFSEWTPLSPSNCKLRSYWVGNLEGREIDDGNEVTDVSADKTPALVDAVNRCFLSQGTFPDVDIAAQLGSLAVYGLEVMNEPTGSPGKWEAANAEWEAPSMRPTEEGFVVEFYASWQTEYIMHYKVAFSPSDVDISDTQLWPLA